MQMVCATQALLRCPIPLSKMLTDILDMLKTPIRLAQSNVSACIEEVHSSHLSCSTDCHSWVEGV